VATRPCDLRPSYVRAIAVFPRPRTHNRRPRVSTLPDLKAQSKAHMGFATHSASDAIGCSAHCCRADARIANKSIGCARHDPRTSWAQRVARCLCSALGRFFSALVAAAIGGRARNCLPVKCRAHAQVHCVRTGSLASLVHERDQLATPRCNKLSRFATRNAPLRQNATVVFIAQRARASHDTWLHTRVERCRGWLQGHLQRAHSVARDEQPMRIRRRG
jgi:hypothetical protein